MTEKALKRIAKIEQRCATLADVVSSIRSVYSKSNDTQKEYIETMIGAAIWYIPKPQDAWTGFISFAALKAFHPDSGVAKPKFSEEHVYPRKVAARILLSNEELNGKSMVSLFLEKYGKVHYLTSDENKAAQPHQRVGVFTSPDNAYIKAGIELIPVMTEDLNQIKKRDRSVIDKYLYYNKENRNV